MIRRSLVVAAWLGAALVASVPAVASKTQTPRVVENPVLKVEVTGKGRPMIFIPGLTVGGDVWNDAVAHYASRWQCHVVTLGGFAGKARFDGPFLDSVRDSLLAYVRAQKLDHPVIVGHSLGGVVAMELAIAAPDAIGPLVIVDALPFLGGAGDSTATEESARKSMAPMRDMIKAQTQDAYAAFQKQAPWLRSMVAPGPNYDRVVQWAMTSDHASVADAMYDIGTKDLRPALPGIRSPMLVIGTWYGMKDFSTRAAVEATFRRQYASAPRWSLALADTARHFVMLDSPAWTWSQMDAFLAGDAAAVRTR